MKFLSSCRYQAKDFVKISHFGNNFLEVMLVLRNYSLVTFKCKFYCYYSRVHISWNDVFSKILKKPMITHMKAFSRFIDKTQMRFFWVGPFEFLFQEKKKFASSQWKQAARLYEVTFISALWMVSSESWKRLHSN